MNFKEAKRKAIFKKVVGLSIAAPAIASTVISVLKLLYFRLDDGTQMGNAIARPFKQLVYFIYENTQFLSLFWQLSPTPNHMRLSDPQNIHFAVIYIMFFVGLAFLASGRKLIVRLDKINRKIEDQLIEESIKGSSARTREQIEESAVIPSSSIFSQLHQLYIAPVVTAIIGAIVIKLMGV